MDTHLVTVEGLIIFFSLAIAVASWIAYDVHKK